jgi:peptidoglycan/xylan/chitin deacetylase (PgdA/CDA1 family)/uncharacterized caspase-like protein
MISTMQRRAIAAGVVLAVLGGGAAWWMQAKRASAAPGAPASAPAASAPAPADDPALALLKAQVDTQRRIVVLLAEETQLNAADKAAANRVGQQLFHEELGRQAEIERRLDAVVAGAQRDTAVPALLDYMESGAGLYDADRLVFQEPLRALQRSVGRDGSLPAVKLHKRISDDLDAVAEIERTYDREIQQIFSRFEQRAIVLKREKWSDYVAHLKTLYRREQILKDQGVVVPYPPEPAASAAVDEADKEIFGTTLPPHTVAFSFDDGPHRQYTAEVEAILKQYNVPAVFFQVGRNLGHLGPDGKPVLEQGGKVSAQLLADGFTIGNHSFTHAQLSKQTGDALKGEILGTDALLKAVSPQRSPLFRFPYGARNAEGLETLHEAHLRSVMWNIDSLDWADPVPRSIADRVLREVDQQGRGIILFHDIHERTLKALPLVLDRLVAEGYQFAGWQGDGFAVAKGAERPAAEAPKLAVGDGSAWALVIGIDDYAQWPKLQYAVRDAKALGQTLVEKFGLAPDHVVTLLNREATRQGILEAFHGKLAHGAVQKNDRVFVFFAGHGATRTLSSGRDLGYIVPADAGTTPEQLASDAIPMTEVQNIAESLPARHVLFVMDACYSGLGLTRGGAPGGNFMRDNARRIGRQMLTAGGADQMVADGGPNGHSVFTWTLLQGLGGKADLNGDGIITATELAAYVAPAVAAVSHQTPAFGSLPGSEGGEFVFVLPAEGEFLSTSTAQLSGEAIKLNTQLDKAAPVAGAASAVVVTVKDLQGKERVIEAPLPVAATARQRAQRANDRGLQFYREQRYAEAEAEFTEALKLRPDFALAANNLGFVYQKQGKFAEAARWYENALKLDPSRAVAYLNLGDAYAATGEKDKAEKAYRTYLELAPNGSGAAHAKQQLGA